MAQKLTSTDLPSEPASVQVLPFRSAIEKSGAAIGATNQVSTTFGSGSISPAAVWLAKDWDCALSWATLNASIRDGSTPSSTQIRWLMGRSCNGWNSPLGHRMDARTEPLVLPKPKNNSLLCWERNPDPACRKRVWRANSVSTVTAAPIASRLLVPPRNRKAIDG